MHFPGECLKFKSRLCLVKSSNRKRSFLSASSIGTRPVNRSSVSGLVHNGIIGSGEPGANRCIGRWRCLGLIGDPFRTEGIWWTLFIRPTVGFKAAPFAPLNKHLEPAGPRGNIMPLRSQDALNRTISYAQFSRDESHTPPLLP